MPSQLVARKEALEIGDRYEHYTTAYQVHTSFGWCGTAGPLGTLGGLATVHGDRPQDALATRRRLRGRSLANEYNPDCLGYVIHA